jgi:hypothetical protein
VINILPELFREADADYRTQRLLRQAEEYRLARSLPNRASRTKSRGGRVRAFVTSVVKRRAVAMYARRIRSASRGLS